MHFSSCLCLLLAQIQTVDSPDFSKVIQQRAVAATVHIRNLSQRGEGSGVMVAQEGPIVYILTAYHVVKDADSLAVSVFSEKSYPLPEKVYRSARVIAKATDIRDLALLRMIADEKMPGITPVVPARDIPKGEGFPALALGCDHGKAPTILVQKVNGRKKVSYKAGSQTAYFWQVAGAVMKGRSGGPLIGDAGFVIGLCSGTNDGQGYFCHPDEIHRFLKQNVFQWLTEKEPSSAP